MSLLFFWLPCQVFLSGSVKAPLSLNGCGFCGCLALCTALRVGQRLGVTQPSRGLSFGQGSEVFSNFASLINKVGRSDLCVTLPLVHWRGHGGLDFIITTTFCSVRRVLKPVGRTVVGWPSRSLQHVRFQSCSFVSSPGLRLEADQQRYSSRGERPSSSAGEQETIS